MIIMPMKSIYPIHYVTYFYTLDNNWEIRQRYRDGGYVFGVRIFIVTDIRNIDPPNYKMVLIDNSLLKKFTIFFVIYHFLYFIIKSHNGI